MLLLDLNLFRAMMCISGFFISAYYKISLKLPRLGTVTTKETDSYQDVIYYPVRSKDSSLFVQT